MKIKETRHFNRPETNWTMFFSFRLSSVQSKLTNSNEMGFIRNLFFGELKCYKPQESSHRWTRAEMKLFLQWTLHLRNGLQKLQTNTKGFPSPISQSCLWRYFKSDLGWNYLNEWVFIEWEKNTCKTRRPTRFHIKVVQQDPFETEDKWTCISSIKL